MKEEIKITPEGFTKHIVFEKGLWECGKAKDGIGIYITPNEERQSGGVITNEDAKLLADAIYEHLAKVEENS